MYSDFTSYSSMLDVLNGDMHVRYKAVNKQGNPVYMDRASLTENQISYTISQYAVFTRHIASFLGAAKGAMKKAGWEVVAKELERNIGEEMGSATDGIPHHVMFSRGIREETGLEISKTEPSASTEHFVSLMGMIMGTQNPSYSGGAAYGLESSAVPELEIMAELTNSMLKKLRGYPMKQGLLQRFFDYHLRIWEPGHEEGLRETLRKHVTDEHQRADFERGFRAAMETMDDWWTGLHEESRQYLGRSGA